MKAILPVTTAALNFPILGFDPGKTTGWARATLHMEKVLDESQPEKVVFNLNFVTGTVTWPVDAGILETLVTGNDLLPYPR